MPGETLLDFAFYIAAGCGHLYRELDNYPYHQDIIKAEPRHAGYAYCTDKQHCLAVRRYSEYQCNPAARIPEDNPAYYCRTYCDNHCDK